MSNVHFYWFAPTSGDGEFLGLARPQREPTLEYLIEVAQAAERAGFEGMLVPTGIPYLDSWLVGFAIAQHTRRIKPLVAFRPGFIAPTVAAKLSATFDRFTKGRLLVNVVTGGSPKELGQDGDFLDHDERYERTREFLDVILKCWTGETFSHKGRFFEVRDAQLVPPLHQPGRIPIYFGGSSDIAKEIAARYADVYLQWGEPVAQVKAQIEDVRSRAARYGRAPEFGVRLHVVVRDTEREAWDAAYRLISRIDEDVRRKMDRVFEETDSVAQRRITELVRQGERFDKCTWTGIGKIRKGAGTALVGTPDQIEEALQDYIDAGVTHFILSGYPHAEEALRFGDDVLPRFAKITV
jgi:alkanesulfonate monooxygenase